MAKSAKPLYLDTTETSAGIDFSPNLNNINASEPSDEKNLYTVLDGLAHYKRLSDNICNTLLLCATADDFVFGDRLQKMLACGTLLQVDDSGKVLSANFCRQRICPMCQRRRSLKIGAEFSELMDSLDCSWLHLVLTVPNCSASELSDLLDTMQICSSRLFSLDCVKKAFKGIARCTEVTYNPLRDDYHPHFHCLIAVNKSYFNSRYYLNIEYIRQLWTVIFCSAQAGYKVKNRADSWIYKQLESFDFDSTVLLQCSITKADNGAVSEIAKYCVKPLDLHLNGFDLYEPLHNIFYALHNRRLVQTYGIIKETFSALGVDIDTFPEDENTLDRTNVRYYNYNRRKGGYEPSSIISVYTD